MQRPDYLGGSIVNLMASLELGLGGPGTGYPPARLLLPDRVARAGRVVLLVLDGLGYDHLSAGAAGSHLRAGLLGALDSVFPPTTATAITSFLTGVAPLQHGLTGWYTYFRELGTVATVLPYVTRAGRTNLGTAGVGAAALYGLTPVFDRLPVQSAAVLPAGIADSAYSRALAGRALRVRFRSLRGLVRGVVDTVRRAPGRAFVYAYWPELDRLAHRHGVASVQVAGHLGELDAAVDRLCGALSGSDTLLLVSADHGFIDVPEARWLRLEHHPRLADALVLPLCGEPRTAYCYVHPEHSPGFPDAAQEHLGEAVEVWPSGVLLEEGWLGVGESHPRVWQRVGHWALLLREGWCLTDRLLGEKGHPMVGFHGGASDRERRVPLAAWEL
jgi:hypothetical protein